MSEPSQSPALATEPAVRSEPSTPSRWARVRSIGRWALFAVGVAGVALLVREAGPAAVWATLLRAGVWLPFVVLFEIGFAGMDVFALRWLYGERAAKVPFLVWLRSALVAYGIMAFLPAGRAGGEVMRATSLAPYVGGARAVAGATVLQGISLWGNTLISVPCYIAVAIATGPGSVLSWLVLGNGLVTGLIGSLVLGAARISRVGGWLGKRIKALAIHGAHFDAHLREMPAVPAASILASLGGRVFQTFQYAVLLAAVGGSLTVSGAIVAQAIHLVGAGLGDMVPNQAGITESVYRVFGDSLSLDPARAISIALVYRVCQFVLAGSCLLVGALWKPPAGVAGQGLDAPPETHG